MKKRNKVTDVIKAESKPANELNPKENEKHLKSGNLTKEQESELYQKCMDSLEYKEERFVTACGGIRPLPILLPKDKE